jgi:hypothetical protein
MGQVSTATHGNKCLMRPPIEYIKRLLEETYPNHAYLVKHRLKDYGMMQSFMTSRSLTWGTKLDEEPNGSDTVPFC